MTEDANVADVEGFWSYAKYWPYIYRGVPKKLFLIYLAELSYGFNN
ncbi:MAG: hypothetical protein AB1465_06905 [Patescibacteria group bacterium]